MSVILSSEKNDILYVDFAVTGSRGVDKFCKAKLIPNYNEIIGNTSEYYCQIVKASVPLQTIPQVNATNSFLTLISRVGGDDIVMNLPDCFTLLDFLGHLNAFGGEAGFDLFEFSLGNAGRIQITFSGTMDYYIQLSEIAQDIFDMDELIYQDDASPEDLQVKGESVVYDRLDQLERVVFISYGLNSKKEVFSSDAENLENILFDVNVSNSFNMSWVVDPDSSTPITYNLSETPRQNLVFVPPNGLRSIKMSGSSPIQTIDIEALALYKDQTQNAIKLPPRSTFNLKVAFYKVTTSS